MPMPVVFRQSASVIVVAKIVFYFLSAKFWCRFCSYILPYR